MMDDDVMDYLYARLPRWTTAHDAMALIVAGVSLGVALGLWMTL